MPIEKRVTTLERRVRRYRMTCVLLGLVCLATGAIGVKQVAALNFSSTENKATVARLSREVAEMERELKSQAADSSLLKFDISQLGSNISQLESDVRRLEALPDKRTPQLNGANPRLRPTVKRLKTYWVQFVPVVMGRIPDSRKDVGKRTVLTYLNATIDPITGRVDSRVELLVMGGIVTRVLFFK